MESTWTIHGQLCKVFTFHGFGKCWCHFQAFQHLLRGQMGLKNDPEARGSALFQHETISIHIGKVRTNFHDFGPGSGPGFGSRTRSILVQVMDHVFDQVLTLFHVGGAWPTGHIPSSALAQMKYCLLASNLLLPRVLIQKASPGVWSQVVDMFSTTKIYFAETCQWICSHVVWHALNY